MPIIDTRYGQLDVPDADHDLIGRFLAQYGEWAWDEVVFVASILEPGARVLDVGAYLGTFGLGLGLRQSLSSICYVEANPQIIPHLRENVRRLKRQPSQVVSALVGVEAGRPYSGFADAGNHGSLSFADQAHGEPFSEAPDSTVSLRDLREIYGPFDLIKLDVEGMEYELVQSDAEHLRAGASKLWLECNESTASLQLVDLILSLGLEIYYFAFPSYNPNNLRNDPDPIFPFAYEAGLLAGKKLSPRLDPALEAHQCLLFPIRSVEELRAAMWRTPRWGKKEWEAKSANEVVALAGRAMLGQDFDRFLSESAPQPQWQDGKAFTAHLHDLEAQLQRQKEQLTTERQAYERFNRESESRFADLTRKAEEREQELSQAINARERALSDAAKAHEQEVNTLEAELRVQLENGRVLREQIVDLTERIRRSQEALDAQGDQLSQSRAVASERLFQLDIAYPKIKNAEEAAARVQARMLQSAREFGREREELLAAQRALRDALAAREPQIGTLAPASEAAPPLGSQSEAPRRSRSTRRWLRKHVAKSNWYQDTFRPRMKRFRRLFQKGKRA